VPATVDDPSPPATSLLAPRFLARLARPELRTILLAGCGGGFDFVHAMLLVPELVRLGKRIVIGSYSFGEPTAIGGDSPIVFDDDGIIARRITPASVADPHYGPEVHVASFLAERLPAAAPAIVYAYYARDFTVPRLTALYTQLIREHAVDAVVVVDGGSDSLMRGDEEGLGDPIEDCVSVTTVAGLSGVDKLLLTVGLGADRFNHVSDAASLRAVAELTAAGGFLGALALAPEDEAFRFYRDCLDHIEARQEFRSVLAGAIVTAGEGHHGREQVPPRLSARVRPGEIFLWPLMPVLWGFDPVRVVERSLLAAWIRDRHTVEGCHAAVLAGRAALGDRLRPVEDLPRHHELRGPGHRR
jgi:hypothetical protein